MKQPLALLILDGFGHREETRGNAIRAARTPHLDALFRDNPTTLISCSGLAVGLPEGQMGNSEVGHTNMGAGRVVYQELTRITRAIEQGDFFQNPALLTAVRDARERAGAVHILGLLSDGGVHSHLDHILALVRLAKQEGVERIFLHAFLDGRDVPPTSGADFIRRTQRALDEIGAGAIATVCGRYYAMDRDQRWERVEQAYRALTAGEGEKAGDPAAAVERSYQAGVTDEFVRPIVCREDGVIRAGDSVLFANFRPDRAREMTRALVDPDFAGFARQRIEPLTYVCMTQYDATMPGVLVAYAPEELKNTLGEYLARAGLTQLRIAETEKYAHVTFFFSGGREQPYEGEERVLIPSPKVATYDLQPEMSAPAVTDEAVRRIESGQYDVIILNFANCDMVGHTGVFDAAVQAVEAVDAGVGRICQALEKAGGIALITADHGNAEQMLEEGSDKPFTAHTVNQVPFCAVGVGGRPLRAGGSLRDIAPTMLDLLSLPQPIEMTGESLFTCRKERE